MVFLLLLRFMVVFLLTIVCHAGITLDLVHRDHVASPQLSRADRLSQMVRRDMQRCSSKRRTMKEDTETTTISSGHDFGMTEYLVRLYVGTPPQAVYMIPDTGSDMNMFKCRLNGTGIFHPGSFFDADNSTSFMGIPCNTSLCRYNLTFMATHDLQANATCVGPTYCAYSDYGYVDGLSTTGIFAYENFTFPQTNNVLKDMVIGCSTSGENLTTINGAHGILGLGNSPLSFLALASPMSFGGNFAMCLVDHLSNLSVSGIFVFGSVPEEVMLPSTMKYTTLDNTSLAGQGLYGLNVSAVYVNGTKLNVSSEAWDNMKESGGTAVDTGTSLTFLNPLAYGPITDALNRKLSGLMKPVVDNKSGFEYCYNSNGYDDIDPKLEIEFDKNVKLQPALKSYLIDVVENSSSTKCLGFMRASAGYSTIGNILLQQHFLVFDVLNNKFGFRNTDCTSTT